MKKRDELTQPDSCLGRAEDDEELFVLLGRDPAAPEAIRAWVHQRVWLGKNVYSDAQIQTALDCAKRMEGDNDAAAGERKGR